MRETTIEKARKKGYTLRYVCSEVNKYLGIHAHINTFALAMKDKNNYSRREALLRETAAKIVDDLPNIALTTDSFRLKARAAGFTLKDVWEYHSQKYEKSYAYAAFAKACQLSVSASAPYERRIAQEAAECLKEMEEKRAKGR